MSTLLIDAKTCIKCNTCATVCVTTIIDQATETAFPSIGAEKANYCIKCGHCESFCPEKALTLDFLVEEKLQTNTDDIRIESAKLAMYIKKRRSIRHFTSRTVDKNTIADILDIARYAASGGNAQQVKWLVILDPSVVNSVARLTIDWMRTIQNTAHPLAAYVPMLIAAWDSGSDIICNGAPHLLVAHVPVHVIDDPTEAVIALTHVDIAAPSFGIGTCWAGFIKMALDSYQPLKDLFSIPEGRKAACPMLFGYSKYKATSIPRRNTMDVSWR